MLLTRPEDLVFALLDVTHLGPMDLRNAIWLWPYDRLIALSLVCIIP